MNQRERLIRMYLETPRISYKGDSMSSQILSDDELAEIARRATMATPGPWRRTKDSVDINKGRQTLIAFAKLPDPDLLPHIRYEQDAEFIAHARTDVPRLVAEILRLREIHKEVIDRLNQK